MGKSLSSVYCPLYFYPFGSGDYGGWRRWRMPVVAIALIYFVAIGGGLKRYYTVLDREDWWG
ncbi:MAG: hypothetical protein F6K24_25555, partial [Okeania sp. SIO2D1]|nr:hypothetical protein [Okeania sp. SIO2D1]